MLSQYIPGQCKKNIIIHDTAKNAIYTYRNGRGIPLLRSWGRSHIISLVGAVSKCALFKPREKCRTRHFVVLEPHQYDPALHYSYTVYRGRRMAKT
jgi:hypothetical protein